MTISIDSIFPLAEQTVPLYEKLPDQVAAQGAFIQIDEDGEVSAGTDLVGGGVPMDVWHRRTMRIAVHPRVSGKALVEYLQSDRAQALLKRLHEGHTVEWDGSNYVGRLNTDAQQAREELDEDLDPRGPYKAGLDLVEVWGASEFVFANGNNRLHNVWHEQSLEEAVRECQAECEANDLYVEGGADAFREVLLDEALERLQDGPNSRDPTLNHRHLEALVEHDRATRDEVEDYAIEHGVLDARGYRMLQPASDPTIRVLYKPAERSAQVLVRLEDGTETATVYQTADLPPEDDDAAEMVNAWLDAQGEGSEGGEGPSIPRDA